MKVTHFDPSRDLIIIGASIWGRHRARRLLLAVDTGSSETVIQPAVIDSLGYSPWEGTAITTVRAALGKEQGYTLAVRRFTALGFAFTNYQVHVFDLAAGDDIDGLIGLSLLGQFNYEVRSLEGRIRVERASLGSG